MERLGRGVGRDELRPYSGYVAARAPLFGCNRLARARILGVCHHLGHGPAAMRATNSGLRCIARLSIARAMAPDAQLAVNPPVATSPLRLLATLLACLA
jgi:hypothetical protein